MLDIVKEVQSLQLGLAGYLLAVGPIEQGNRNGVIVEPIEDRLCDLFRLPARVALRIG